MQLCAPRAKLRWGERKWRFPCSIPRKCDPEARRTPPPVNHARPRGKGGAAGATAQRWPGSSLSGRPSFGRTGREMGVGGGWLGLCHQPGHCPLCLVGCGGERGWQVRCCLSVLFSWGTHRCLGTWPGACYVAAQGLGLNLPNHCPGSYLVTTSPFNEKSPKIVQGTTKYKKAHKRPGRCNTVEINKRNQ